MNQFGRKCMRETLLVIKEGVGRSKPSQPKWKVGSGWIHLNWRACATLPTAIKYGSIRDPEPKQWIKCCHIQGDTPCWLHRPSLPHCSLDQASQQGPSHSQNVQVGLKGMRLFCCPNLFFLHVLRNGTGMCRK